jgi:predicted amidohydrolase YtcJ
MPVHGPADLILLGAIVYTADRQQPWAEAVAVKGGRIIYVGGQNGAAALVGPKTKVLDLPGKLILPGFRDAHLHPLTGSFSLLECRLAGPADKNAYLAQVAAYARANADQSFIRGGGWLPDAFPPAGPNRLDLDAVVCDRPVILKSMDGHSAWVNTRALAVSGIRKNIPDPPGGQIVRDLKTGEATGTLREWSAMELVEARLPKPTHRNLTTAGWAFMEMATRLGIVSVHEAMARKEELDAYLDLDRSHELILRVQASLLCEPKSGMEQIQTLQEMRRAYQGRLLSPRTVKLFLDGVVEGHTAWLLKPYEDRPEFHGELLWKPKEFNGMLAALDHAEFQIHVHAIGDGAVRMALDGFQSVLETGGRHDARHMIAHGDLIDARDLARFRELGVIVNLQPAWFYEERNFTRTTLPYLGAERAYGLYKIKSLLQEGAHVICSSDWPFSGELNTFNPLDAIQVGVTRAGIDADPGQAYMPEERVELATLIDCYTIHNARADFQADLTGSLTRGKSADLIVLDRNLFAIPATEISKARVLLTLFEGRSVFRDPSII